MLADSMHNLMRRVFALGLGLDSDILDGTVSLELAPSATHHSFCLRLCTPHTPSAPPGRQRGGGGARTVSGRSPRGDGARLAAARGGQQRGREIHREHGHAVSGGFVCWIIAAHTMALAKVVKKNQG